MKARFNALNYTPEEVRDLSVMHINASFRAVDDSRKWPIFGRFNATERAIRRVRAFWRCYGERNPGGYEYCLQLEREIGDIVNGAI